MKVAVVTGASSGMGREFVKEIVRCFPGLDEVWAVARREERLLELKDSLGDRVVPIKADLVSDSGIMALREALLEKRPDVRVLVNSAGTGIIGDVADTPISELLEMVKLNVDALTAVTTMMLPFMGRGGRIVCLASGAAFMPQPGFGVYAATKAYVLSFCRALNKELKKRKISVTAVCPGPVKTEFFDRAERHQKRVWYKKYIMADAEKVTRKAMEDMKKRREISVYGFSMNAGRFLMKLLPHRILMGFFGI